MKLILLSPVHSGIGLTTNSSSENYCLIGLVNNPDYLKNLIQHYLSIEDKEHDYLLHHFLKDIDIRISTFDELCDILFESNYCVDRNIRLREYNEIVKEFYPEFGYYIDALNLSDHGKLKEIRKKYKNNTYAVSFCYDEEYYSFNENDVIFKYGLVFLGFSDD